MLGAPPRAALPRSPYTAHCLCKLLVYVSIRCSFTCAFLQRHTRGMRKDFRSKCMLRFSSKRCSCTCRAEHCVHRGGAYTVHRRIRVWYWTRSTVSRRGCRALFARHTRGVLEDSRSRCMLRFAEHCLAPHCRVCRALLSNARMAHMKEWLARHTRGTLEVLVTNACYDSLCCVARSTVALPLLPCTALKCKNGSMQELEVSRKEQCRVSHFRTVRAPHAGDT